MMLSVPGRTALAAIIAVLVFMALLPTSTALAVTYAVTQTADGVDTQPGDEFCDVDDGTAGSQCSLRAAVQTANILGGSHIITLPAGTYTLSLAGTGEDAAAQGDLDITANITIRSADNAIGTVTIDANHIDRVFDVRSGGSLTLVGLILTNGHSGNGDGGAIRSDGLLTLQGVTVSNSVADPAVGGGIAVINGTATLRATTVSGNTAANGPFGIGGGGIFVNSTATMTGVNLTVAGNNSHPRTGGGLLTSGTVDLTDSTLATNSAGIGGGFRSEGGSLTLTRVTISGNTADAGGGFDALSGTVNLTNVTIEGNTATVTTGGGGRIQGSAVTMTNVTFGVNSAPVNSTTAGLQTFGASTLTVSNSVFGSACSLAGTLNDNGGNIHTTGNGCPGADANTNGLQLQALADNGGFTQTIALGATSDALDIGAGCPVTDQRGLTRTLGGTCDSGAYELKTGGNGPPVISVIADQTIDEDHPTGPIAFVIADSDTAGAAGLNVGISGNTSPAIPTGSFTFLGAGNNRAVRGTPDIDKNGSGTVTVQVTDGGGATATSAFTLNVQAVNDPSTFTISGNPPASNEDAGVQTIAGFVTSVAPGPATATDEVGQNILTGLSVASTTGGLGFSAISFSAITGELTYQASPNTNGTATIEVFVFDNGSTANGGSNASGRLTFTITVNAVNDPPVNTVPGAQTTPGNTAKVFSTGGGNSISIADIDSGAATNLTVTVSVTAGTGVVSPGPNGTAPPLTAVTGSNTDTLVLTGSVTTLNAAVQGLTFTPQTNVTGVTTLTVTTNDAGNTGTPGALEDIDTVQITVGSLPTLSINDPAAVLEGDTGTPNSIVFTVTLSVASNLTVTVPFTFTDQTATGGAACTAGVDYINTGGTLTFVPTDTSETVTVPVCGDTLDESNETLVVNLGTPVNATINDGQGTGTITDDDAGGTISFAAATASVQENGGTVELTVRRTGGSASGVSVQFATGNQSAQAGADFTTTTGTLTFGVNETTRTITVPISDDLLDEENETFRVTLSNPGGGATLGGTPVATVTIVETTPRGPGLQGQDDSDPSRKDTRVSKDVKETEEAKQQRERTNTSNRDDVATEGNVTEVHQDANPPYVVLANRDGPVTVWLLCGDQCPTIRPGDYIEVDGEKRDEQNFDAEHVKVTRPR